MDETRLRPLGAESEGIWEACAELALPGWARLPVRMTVVRLPDGGLWLHSPIAIDDALAGQLDALGVVRHIVAPNRFHHLFLAAARERWPEARLWASPALVARRRAAQGAELLAEGAPADWGGALEVRLLDGAPRMGEAVFFHRPSATLICSDLVFNVQRRYGPMTAVMLTAMGTHGRLAASRALHLFAQDRAAFMASVQAMAAWPARRIAVGHGEVHESPHAGADLLAAVEARLGSAPPAG